MRSLIHSFGPMAMTTLWLLGLTSVVDARPLERHFGAGDSCYGRVYSPKHLKKHPAQKVREIRFDHFPNVYGVYGDDNKIRFDEKSGEVHFTVSVRFTNTSASYSNSGVCTPEGGRYKCYIECDGGWFFLKDRAPKSILLVNEQGFAVAGCGAEDGRLLDPEPDDKVFRLDRLSEDQCVAPNQVN